MDFIPKEIIFKLLKINYFYNFFSKIRFNIILYKISKIFVIFFTLALFLICPSSLFAVKTDKQKISNDIEIPIEEKNFSGLNTVFGGVGRKFATVQLGLDLLILSYPHYSAFRNRLNLKNYAFWGEWWYKDNWGVKSFYSEQSYEMFGPSNARSISKTNHLGILFKTQHSLSESWKISAGVGLSKTEFNLEENQKLGNSLVGEFRIGTEIFEESWIEFGILSIDSASGEGIGDQRLGATGYLICFSFGI